MIFIVFVVSFLHIRNKISQYSSTCTTHWLGLAAADRQQIHSQAPAAAVFGGPVGRIVWPCVPLLGRRRPRLRPPAPPGRRERGSRGGSQRARSLRRRGRRLRGGVGRRRRRRGRRGRHALGPGTQSIEARSSSGQRTMQAARQSVCWAVTRRARVRPGPQPRPPAGGRRCRRPTATRTPPRRALLPCSPAVKIN